VSESCAGLVGLLDHVLRDSPNLPSYELETVRPNPPLQPEQKTGELHLGHNINLEVFWHMRTYSATNPFYSVHPTIEQIKQDVAYQYTIQDMRRQIADKIFSILTDGRLYQVTVMPEPEITITSWTVHLDWVCTLLLTDPWQAEIGEFVAHDDVGHNTWDISRYVGSSLASAGTHQRRVFQKHDHGWQRRL
jgi:hypothetical protein